MTAPLVPLIACTVTPPCGKCWYCQQQQAGAPVSHEERVLLQIGGASMQSLGGRARAAKLTAERRAEIARKAAVTRWGKR